MLTHTLPICCIICRDTMANQSRTRICCWCNWQSSLSLFWFKDVVDSLREVVFFTQIVIPFIILVYCTVRIINRLRKKTIGDRTKLKRAVFLVTAVMVVFSLCFLPCTIARMVLLIIRVHVEDESIQDKAAVAFDGLMVLSYMDCLLDPLIYCFCSTKFKAIYLSSYLPFLGKDVQVPLDSSTGNSTHPTRNTVIWNLRKTETGTAETECSSKMYLLLESGIWRESMIWREDIHWIFKVLFSVDC